MTIFHRAMDRLADFIWTGRKVNLRFTAEYRTACYVVPIINKLLAEGEDGDACPQEPPRDRSKAFLTTTHFGAQSLSISDR